MKVSGQLYTPSALPLEKEPPSTHWRLGGPQSWSERDGEEKHFQPLPGLEPPIIHSVAQSYTTELRVSWLLKFRHNQHKTVCSVNSIRFMSSLRYITKLRG